MEINFSSTHEWNETIIDTAIPYTIFTYNFSQSKNFNGSYEFNGTLGMPVDSDDGLLDNAIMIFIVFSSLAVVANLIVLRLLYKKGSKRTIFDLTLCSLITANLICSITYLVENGMYLKMTGEPGHTFLMVLYQSSIFAFLVSLMHIIVITFEQLFAVLFPLKLRLIITKRRVIYSIVGAWLLSLVVTIISATLLDEQKGMEVFGSLLISFGILLIILYTILGIKIIILVKEKNFRWNKEHRVLVNAFAITFTFLACIFPIAIVSVTSSRLNNLAYLLSSFVAIKLFLDPVFYFFVSFWRAKRDAMRRTKTLHMQQLKGTVSTQNNPAFDDTNI